VALDTRADADASEGDGVGKGPVGLTTGQVAIDVREVDKTFRIPTHRIDRLKERLARPLARQEFRQLEALRDVTFDVQRGEFFGIVGRNGSGKSTLLKILASIYRADGGSVRMAGTLAPFIELGVGFDMELSARENVVLNGVMMGLTPKEARSRLDQVLEFAELEEFVEVKLKNYSSGMLVRLGFSVMIQADIRHPADRRGARGRGRRVPTEVCRRVPQYAGQGKDDCPGDPRHGGCRGVLPSGDAPERGQDGRDRRSWGSRPEVPAAQLREGP